MSWRDVQARLRDLGYDPGPIDGVVGRLTTAACVSYAFDQLDTPSRTSKAGVAAIAGHEGFVPGPYRDVRGIWTVYVGHTASAGPPVPAQMPRGMPDDLDAAIRTGMAVFRHDLGKFEDRVARAFTRPLEQHQWDAAVSFDLNTGGILRATWVKSFNAGKDDLAARQIMNWRRPAAIKERREAEQRLFRDGTYPDRPMAVWGVSPTGAVQWGKPIRTYRPEEVADMMRIA